MSSLIIDDLQMWIDELCQIVESDPDINKCVQVAGTASYKTQSLEAIRIIRPNIIFIDIQLGWAKGYELVDEILVFHKPFAIIFVTAEQNEEVATINAMSMKGLNFRFARKSSTLKTELKEACLAFYKHWVDTNLWEKDSQENLWEITTESGEKVWIATERILKISTFRPNAGKRTNRLSVHFDVGNDQTNIPIQTTDGLSKSEKPLHGTISGFSIESLANKLKKPFLQVNRNQIVNMKFVKEYKKSSLLAKVKGISVSISKKNKEKFETLYQEYNSIR